MRHSIFFIFLSFLGFFGCTKDSDIPEEPVQTGAPEIQFKTLLSNQGSIWGFDWLPDGNLLFTKKTGSLHLYDSSTGSTQAISGLPNNISSAGQGGLLDVGVAPDYATTRQVYITYSIDGGFLRLARFSLNGTSATNWETLATTESASLWSGHFGSRIAFGSDGKVYWSVGEGGGGSLGGASSPHQNGQKLNTLWGKIHRINRNGSVPLDNPLIPGSAAVSTIFSYGHRNVQSLAFQATTQQLYVAEHGPSGGCELNLIAAANNYGWPLYSMGINYNGTAISNGHTATGITAPLVHWSPALAPSGLTFINHSSFRDWNGNLLIGSLARRQLLMIAMENGLPGTQTVLYTGGRVRNVKQGPSGKIYVSVEDAGQLLELTAKP